MWGIKAYSSPKSDNMISPLLHLSFWWFITPSKLKFKQSNKITICVTCHHKKTSFLLLASIKIVPINAATNLHSSSFTKPSPQNVFAHSVLVAITFSRQTESMILVLEGSHRLFWTKTRSSHDLSLAWEIVVWVAATATAHISIFHLV